MVKKEQLQSLQHDSGLNTYDRVDMLKSFSDAQVLNSLLHIDMQSMHTKVYITAYTETSNGKPLFLKPLREKINDICIGNSVSRNYKTQKGPVKSTKSLPFIIQQKSRYGGWCHSCSNLTVKYGDYFNERTMWDMLLSNDLETATLAGTTIVQTVIPDDKYKIDFNYFIEDEITN